MSKLQTFINKLTDQQQLSHTEILISATSVLIAITLMAIISKKFLSGLTLPFIVASMGASAVLLFAVPSSPMNRPWALVMGHISSAIIGVTCAQQIDSLQFAAPAAAAGAILMMQYLRCLHPPGGATAMLIVLGDAHVHTAGYQFILTPIVLNILILLCATWAIRYIARQINQQQQHKSSFQWVDKLKQQPSLTPHVTLADIESARIQLGTYIDVVDDELLKLLRLATHNSHQRRLGELRCKELMLPVPLYAEFGSSLEEVWGWFQQHRLTAVPVVNRARHVIGIITLNDFVNQAAAFPQDTLEQRIKALVQATPELTSNKPEVVGQIMTSPVITGQESDKVADLLPLLDNRQIHHIPIVDQANKLTGLLSRSEIAAILERD